MGKRNRNCDEVDKPLIEFPKPPLLEREKRACTCVGIQNFFMMKHMIASAIASSRSSGFLVDGQLEASLSSPS